MRRAALLILVFALFTAGCSKVEKEIDKPGPAPPYDPKAAALPANVTPDNPADIPLESAWNPGEARKQQDAAETDNVAPAKSSDEATDEDAAPEKDSP